MIFVSFVNENGTATIKTISWKQIHCSEKSEDWKSPIEHHLENNGLSQALEQRWSETIKSIIKEYLINLT
jgi:hypothetical protein